MCKFHKDVAIQIATGDDDIIDPVRYGVMMCALSRYWIDLYMPELDYLDGYSTYEMATSKAVTALKNAPVISALSEDIPRVVAYAKEHAPQLRQAVDEVIAQRSLTLESLHLPKKPLNNLKAISAISSGIYEGDPAVRLHIRESVEDSAHEPMRAALEELFEKNNFEPVLQNMIAGSFAKLMTEAQDKVNPRLLSAYESLPYGFRTSFASCAMHGSGGTVGTHALCLMMPAAAGAFGMMASPVIAVGVDRALDWRQGNAFSWKRSASVAAISLSVAFGINSLWPHDHMHTAKAQELSLQSKDVQDILTRDARNRYEKLPENLRLRVDEQAAKRNMTPEIYLTICDGSDSLGREISSFEAAQRKQPDTSWRTTLVRSNTL